MTFRLKQISKVIFNSGCLIKSTKNKRKAKHLPFNAYTYIYHSITKITLSDGEIYTLKLHGISEMDEQWKINDEIGFLLFKLPDFLITGPEIFFTGYS